MTFRVMWIQSALDDLTHAWMSSDSSSRVDINSAVYRLDKQLEHDPFAICESRDPGEWICFSHPLSALVEIDQDN